METVDALRYIRRLIDAGESGEAEMAAMLLHIGRIVDDALDSIDDCPAYPRCGCIAQGKVKDCPNLMGRTA